MPFSQNFPRLWPKCHFPKTFQGFGQKCHFPTTFQGFGQNAIFLQLSKALAKMPFSYNFPRLWPKCHFPTTFQGFGQNAIFLQLSKALAKMPFSYNFPRLLAKNAIFPKLSMSLAPKAISQASQSFENCMNPVRCGKTLKQSKIGKVNMPNSVTNSLLGTPVPPQTWIRFVSPAHSKRCYCSRNNLFQRRGVMKQIQSWRGLSSRWLPTSDTCFVTWIT